MAEQDPEAFWSEVFSRDPSRIRAALETVTEAERVEIVGHLRRMASEPRWNDEQRAAAIVALQALEQPREL